MDMGRDGTTGTGPEATLHGAFPVKALLRASKWLACSDALLKLEESMKMNPFRLVLLLVPLTGPQLLAAEKIRVSSFSTILTEIAQQGGGERVEVTAHVQPGVDPHDFEPKPSDLRTVSRAQLVLLSAKHMEGYVNKLEEATGGKGNFLQVGNGFGSLKMPDEAHGRKDVEDPHWWHSIDNVRQATKMVRDALIKVSPSDSAVFNENAAAYLA